MLYVRTLTCPPGPLVKINPAPEKAGSGTAVICFPKTSLYPMTEPRLSQHLPKDKCLVSYMPDSEMFDSQLSVFLSRVFIRKQNSHWDTRCEKTEVLSPPSRRQISCRVTSLELISIPLQLTSYNGNLYNIVRVHRITTSNTYKDFIISSET